MDQLPQGAALYDPEAGCILYANQRFVRRLSLGSAQAALPTGILWDVPGVHRLTTPADDLVIKTAEFPLSEHPNAMLAQEAETLLGSPVAGALQHAFPLGVAWIDRHTDQAVLINQPFLDAWRLPPGRESDRGSKLRTACAGLALDTAIIDAAWPDHDQGTGRFEEVALTDGRSLRLATFDLVSGHRWILVEDVTEPKQQRLAALASELRVQESQRLESLSVLAGGIAHDFNNLLLVILANAELLREDGQLDANALSAVTDIRLAAERASELSAKMLAYSGRGHMINEPTNLVEVVNRAVLELEVDETARGLMTVDEPSEEATVSGDPDQLRQLFKAVLLNAQQSAGVQRITLTCKIDTWSTDALSTLYLGDQLVSGPYVEVRIDDDGEGIEPGLLPRVFDPFFSTRGPSRGLGLAAAAGIARSHGGTIDVQSARGDGARVRVLLPLVKARARRTSSPSTPRAPTHRATILLVDDESLVRRSARQALEQVGLHVIEAQTGEAALDLFSQSPERFDLVIMDISMPGANGDVVAKQMRSMTERPVPLVLSSGYRPQLDLGETGVADRFLRKPYRRADLVQTARQLLNLES